MIVLILIITAMSYRSAMVYSYSNVAAVDESGLNRLVIRLFYDRNDNGVKDNDELLVTDNQFGYLYSNVFNGSCELDTTIVQVVNLLNPITLNTERCYWISVIDSNASSTNYDYFIYDPIVRDEPIRTDLGFDPFTDYLPSIYVPNNSVQSSSEAVNCELPQIEYLGQGKNNWVLDEGFDGFLVKQTRPFSFTKQNGPNFETVHNNDRIWQSTYFTNTLNFVYADTIPLGYFESGTTVLMVFVDDDADNRDTNIIDSNGEIHMVIDSNENLVNYVEFIVEIDGQYTIDSADSIGFIYGCSFGNTSTPIAPEPLNYKVYLPSLNKG